MPKSILIIDDSQTSLELMKNMLGKEGYNVSTALNGRQGIEKALQIKPDLAVIDTLLPDIGGFEVSENIRKALSTTKILIITGAFDAIDGVKAKRSGADDYCVKTKDMKLLLETVKKLV